MIVNRPWGSYTVLSSNENYWHKKLVVLPGKRLSLQIHCERDEFWMIESGTGVVRIGDDYMSASAGKTFFVLHGTPHRIENTGDAPLVFTEIAIGTSVREDDIFRIEDDFGRCDVT